MASLEEFRTAVAARAEGTPYVVTPTEKGFDVQINIADAKYYALLYKQGLTKTFIHHVALNEAEQTFTVVDDSRQLEWRGGAEIEGGVPRPVLGASYGRRIGTIREVAYRKEYAWNERGEYDKVVDYSFRSSDGNRLIKDAAEQLGLQERLATVSRIAVGFGIFGAVGAVVALVSLLVAASKGVL